MSFFPSRTVAIDILGWPIHWYGVLYLVAFLIAWHIGPKLLKYRGLAISKNDFSDILVAAILGVIVGGRLGFVLFYAPRMVIDAPLEIFAVWKGGMSSHGGFLGVAIALVWTLRKKNVPILPFADIAVIPAAIGLACGRFGNFINLELYGTPTSLPWAIAIPGVEGLRHPTQIYAMLKDLFIAAVCFAHLRRSSVPGRTFALFLMTYGVLRFLIEYLRVQDFLYPLPFFLSEGQLLTVPVFLIGLSLWIWLGRRRNS